MTSSEIRQKFLEFFQKRGHVVIPSASLVPENDLSVLFNTAGMQPLIPYLLGEKHPHGQRLVNIQKCVRTQDIDEVGDNTHDTFFEMMGNWSLGDPARTADGVQSGGYWKKEAIEWSFELLTSKEGFSFDPNRLYITCFAGNENAPKDTESAEFWKKVGIPENRIYFLDSNWWFVGDNGPCGPDTEMFYDIVGGLGDLDHEQFLQADKNQKIVEIWNDVFMEYIKKDGKVIGTLAQRNVDTGSGLERVAMIAQGKDNIFETDLFENLIKILPENLSTKDKRIIVDHLRTSVLLLSDGVVPSNKDRGYILRRLLRRSFVKEYMLKLSPQIFENIIIAVIDKYKNYYPLLIENKDEIINNYFAEWKKFKEILDNARKELKKLDQTELTGAKVFNISSTLGISPEITKSLGYSFNQEDYEQELKKHQELSRKGAKEKFKKI